MSLEEWLTDITDGLSWNWVTINRKGKTIAAEGRSGSATVALGYGATTSEALGDLDREIERRTKALGE